MNDKAAPWAEVYPNIQGQGGSQYVPLLWAHDLPKLRPDFVDEVVDERSTPDKLRMMLDMARADVSAITYDRADQISLDRIGRDAVRLRPLSYTHHVRFYKSLDVRNTLQAGVTQGFRTLRQTLAKEGRPHEPDSDVAPCKLGMSCLIVEGEVKAPRRIMTTMRSPEMIYYPGAKHASFSGGVEIQDIAPGDLSLDVILARTAVRECREELALEFDSGDVEVLGVWRDLERCSAQAFAFITVDDLDALAIDKNAELTEYAFEGLEPGFWERILGGAARTPELDFLLMLLKARGA